MHKLGLIITARVKSSRLPEKVLKTIKGRRALDILLDHVIPNDGFYDVVLAIPENKDDDILAEIGAQRGIEVYRGQDASPLHRLYECATEHEFDYVIRITADDILIDQNLLRQQIKWAMRGNLDYCYMRRCPEGIAGEVIKTSALKSVVDTVGDVPVEFISYYLKNDGFFYKEFYPPYEYQNTYRLTLDYEEDLQLLREIYNALPEPIGTLDIIHFLGKHKTFLQINKLPEVTVYTCNYNYSKYVIDCMKSVYAQDYKDYEFIVYDDHSSDSSISDIVEFYTGLDHESRKRTTIMRNDKNMGLPATCNKVIGLARGKYIIRVDADDVIEPSAFRKMVEAMKINESQGCIAGYYETRSALTHTSEVIENRWHPGCAMMSRWCINELMFKEGLKYEEGREMFDRFRQRYNVTFIREPLWKYRQHGEQKTKQPDHPKNTGGSV